MSRESWTVGDYTITSIVEEHKPAGKVVADGDAYRFVPV